jgi:hypothetical protein
MIAISEIARFIMHLISMRKYTRAVWTDATIAAWAAAASGVHAA